MNRTKIVVDDSGCLAVLAMDGDRCDAVVRVELPEDQGRVAFAELSSDTTWIGADRMRAAARALLVAADLLDGTLEVATGGYVARDAPREPKTLGQVFAEEQFRPLPGDPDPDPTRRCTDFLLGKPNGHCESDGHYRCRRATLLQIGAALTDRDTRSGCRIEPGCAVAPEGSDVACQSCWETQRQRLADEEEA